MERIIIYEVTLINVVMSMAPKVLQSRKLIQDVRWSMLLSIKLNLHALAYPPYLIDIIKEVIFMQ